MDENALGAHLRRLREAVTPDQVGLPAGGRRRTPGLRRAELATLAGVSVDYLTRLEQGRDTHPSPQVLAALADTLLLDEDQRRLLFRMGTISGASELCPSLEPPADAVRPALAAVVEHLEPAPAVVVNRLGDVLARTEAWVRLTAPLGLAGDDANVLRWLFTDDGARRALAAWDRVADDATAAMMAANQPDDPSVAAFLDELVDAAGSELERRLSSGCTVAPRPSVVRLHHPVAGELRLVPEPLSGAGAGQWLVVWLPADAATADALDDLIRAGGPGLRVVPG